MSFMGIIIGLVSIVVGGAGIYFRFMRNQAAERDERRGELKQENRQAKVDDDRLARDRRIKDEVEALPADKLLDRARRWVRK